MGKVFGIEKKVATAHTVFLFFPFTEVSKFFLSHHHVLKLKNHH